MSIYLFSYLIHADASKIIRSAYGGQKEYSDLSTEALVMWNQWNDDLKTIDEDKANGLKNGDKVWMNNGVLMCSDRTELTDFEKASAAKSNVAGQPPAVLTTIDPQDLAEAKMRGISHGLAPFAKDAAGILDTTGGVIAADKACLLALYKAKQAGAKFVLGPVAGAFSSFIYAKGDAKQVIGIKTADGKTHEATTVIMACGGWTPSLVPEMDGLCETTAGSVALFKIPADSPLRQKYSYDNFPAWMFKQREGADGGLYGFPVDHNGVMKIGYRGIKYTNPVRQSDGKDRSVPRTRWSVDEPITDLPAKAHEVIKRFVDNYMPDLGAEGIDIWMSRLCWYTDSYDNHYVIDRVPGLEGVMCATGGSGHAFKFLPNLGKWVADVLEQKDMDRALAKAWQWRAMKEDEKPTNVLMLGRGDSRTLDNTVLVSVDAVENPVAEMEKLSVS